jgi:hypothetical protein
VIAIIKRSFMRVPSDLSAEREDEADQERVLRVLPLAGIRKGLAFAACPQG